MKVKVTKSQLREMKRRNASRSDALTPVPESEWPDSHLSSPSRPKRVLLSRRYLVQEFLEDSGVIRLSVNRTLIGRDGDWADGITWDDLQQIKRDCGYGDSYAIEIYPQDSAVVNVANIRHLWILPAPLNIGWGQTS